MEVLYECESTEINIWPKEKKNGENCIMRNFKKIVYNYWHKQYALL
jgi:hypothetical protein